MHGRCRVLGLHHVNPDAAQPLLWDLGFLALGALLVLVGVAIARRSRAPSPARSLTTSTNEGT